MNITSEGIKMVLVGAAIAGAGVLVSAFCRNSGIITAFVGVVFTLFSAFFFRDPERNRKFAADEIACPADGTILTVKSEGDPGVTVVRMFLSIFNVHVQRSPLEGKIEDVRFTPGTFAIANRPEASRNQRNLIRIKGAGGKSADVEQITGSIARRIACWVKPGQEVRAGERIGMIFFGSQVALYLPSTAKVEVKPGDKVRGAETVIGHW